MAFKRTTVAKYKDTAFRVELTNRGAPPVPEDQTVLAVRWVAQHSDLYYRSDAGWFWARPEFRRTADGNNEVHYPGPWLPSLYGPLY